MSASATKRWPGTGSRVLGPGTRVSPRTRIRFRELRLRSGLPRGQISHDGLRVSSHQVIHRAPEDGLGLKRGAGGMACLLGGLVAQPLVDLGDYAAESALAVLADDDVHLPGAL